jgi:hypothetical protein
MSSPIIQGEGGAMKREIALLGLIVGLFLVGGLANSVATLGALDLNGTWLYAYSRSEARPSGANWQEVKVPYGSGFILLDGLN